MATNFRDKTFFLKMDLFVQNKLSFPGSDIGKHICIMKLSRNQFSEKKTIYKLMGSQVSNKYRLEGIGLLICTFKSGISLANSPDVIFNISHT